MAKFKSLRGIAAVAATGALALGLAACGGGGNSGSDGDLTVGFVAVGPEGGWRDANENDVKSAFKDADITLKYSPSNKGDQNSQISAFSSFVDEEVDAIVLSATEATGWEKSLKEAKDADIPVILLDRGIEPDEDSLYTSHIAPDNVGISENVAKYFNEQFPDGANYAVLEGPPGLSVVNDRNKGFKATIAKNMKLVDSQTAEWSTEKAKSVFETMLKSKKNDIQFVFAQNDEMGLGAAQAVKEAGLTPGKDVKIATIDGTKPALESLEKGELSFVGEYNPLFGEQAVDAVKKAVDGEDVDKQIVIESEVFDSPEAAKKALPDRKY
ncbi:MAG: ABC transporter substrate-binding protein [Galactobacter sp.]|uniref:ABC transporter substrate-binding protein n=1 Tax=Galactobacter sp. TaxID=2676125 RepID=UPI0025C2347B|nr:ABC transporter substrate-binding protein [Galactobacter sp.]